VKIFDKEFLKCDDNPGGRVARWYIFKPKIPIKINFGGSGN
jgi:hypothetical protein